MRFNILFVSVAFCFLPVLSFAQVEKTFQDTAVIDASQKTYTQELNKYTSEKAAEHFCTHTLFIINGKKQNKSIRDCQSLLKKHRNDFIEIITKEAEIKKFTRNSEVNQIVVITTRRKKRN